MGEEEEDRMCAVKKKIVYKCTFEVSSYCSFTEKFKICAFLKDDHQFSLVVLMIKPKMPYKWDKGSLNGPHPIFR